jgi:hypothetical protein
MKCYCGCDVFFAVYNLKYISPILCGDPRGGTATVLMYECRVCHQLYPIATTAAEVNKLYQALDPDRKAFVDDLKNTLQEHIAGGLGLEIKGSGVGID